MHTIVLAVLVSLMPLVTVWTAIFLPLRFSKGTTSLIQAVASGFLLGGILIDLMPRVLQGGVRFSYIISFIIGFVLMTFLQRKQRECCGMNTVKSMRKFIFPFLTEFFITGVLIGIASLINITLLTIIALSFGLCNFVCGLSISSRFTENQFYGVKRFKITSAITVLFPVGALLSATFLSYIPLQWVNDLLSFAIAVLLYLVLDELLPEALKINKVLSLIFLFSAITFVFLLFLLIQINR